MLEIVADDKEEKVKNGNVGIVMDEKNKEQFSNKEESNMTSNLDVEAQKVPEDDVSSTSLGKEEETKELEEVLEKKKEHISPILGTEEAHLQSEENNQTYLTSAENNEKRLVGVESKEELIPTDNSREVHHQKAENKEDHLQRIDNKEEQHLQSKESCDMASNDKTNGMPMETSDKHVVSLPTSDLASEAINVQISNFL